MAGTGGGFNLIPATSPMLSLEVTQRQLRDANSPLVRLGDLGELHPIEQSIVRSLVAGQRSWRASSPRIFGAQPHIKDMGKSETEFETVQLKDYSGWYVLITPHHGVVHRISSFKTEAEARKWIGENSADWLATHTGRRSNG